MVESKIEKRKKAAIVTNNLRCERHQQYYSKVEKYLITNGWDISTTFNVDKVIFCGCGFHDQMYDKFRNTLEQLREISFPEKDIVIMGCLPKTQEERLGKAFHGQTVALHQEHLLDEMIQAKVPFKEITDSNLFRPHKAVDVSDDFFYIKISEGCLKQCTFCVIPKAKGDLRSVPREKIIHQFNTAIKKGIKKIFLMGEDAFAYGVDTGTTIVDLMESLVEIAPDVELYCGHLHIQWLKKYAEGILSLCRRGYIKKILMGLQHVNDVILRRMGRRILFPEVYDIIKTIKKEFPHVIFEVDIMVGFPGESEAIFNELLEFFKQDTCFDRVRPFGYSDVKGAPSARLKDKVPQEEVIIRWERLIEVLGDRSAINRNDGLDSADASYKLTLEENYFFCKNTFRDGEGITAETDFLKAKTGVSQETLSNFDF